MFTKEVASLVSLSGLYSVVTKEFASLVSLSGLCSVVTKEVSCWLCFLYIYSRLVSVTDALFFGFVWLVLDSRCVWSGVRRLIDQPAGLFIRMNVM